MPHNYYSSIQPDRTIKEKVQCFIKYIATEEEKEEVENINSDIVLNNYLIKFWIKRDPNPKTIFNEFKDEHLKRFIFANNYLGGWQTDRGRVYILHGTPSEIISYPMNNSLSSIYSDLEIWIYDNYTQHVEISNIFMEIDPKRVKFVFADKMGFGVKEQIYSTEDNEKIDNRVLINPF